MRLDQYVVQYHQFPSRTKAAEAIRRGDVLVNGLMVKPSMVISDADVVTVLRLPQYVSRSADKLLEALDAFGIDLTNHVVLDIGSSTGGFTQVALERHAARVIAVDVGTDQMDASLRHDSRVSLHEQTNFKQLLPAALPLIHTTLIDVSFISTIEHLPHLFQFGTQWLCLIKPQFETKGLGLVHGVVRDQDHIDRAMDRLRDVVALHHKQLRATLPCRTIGKTGNQEYMVWIT
jgi:23S rRNA (cytidine1920-2'-O)/16S rRNA (cytidine1409-2'-O)-methyltransferase